ncbi:MAG: hypothetical protein RLZZ297_1596 [Chloroflexota bacterium]|jgi:hypothetical protein
MERRIFEVTWQDGLGDVPRGPQYAAVVDEALRLSVWHVKCVVLGCSVTASEVRMVIQCGGSAEPHALIDWIRAAAAFAVSCYTGYAPQWDAPYHYAWLAPECAGVAILRCMALQHEATRPVAPTVNQSTVL